MYRCYDFGKKDGFQIEMPYVRHKEEYVGINDWGEDQYAIYTETLDYEYMVGSLTIYYTVSDFIYEPTPGTMQFRCVVMY